MKHKEKKKHLESRYLPPAKRSRDELNLQEHLLQYKEAGEDSNSSGYLTFIPPAKKRSGTDIRTFQGHVSEIRAQVPGYGPTKERSSSSEYFSCVSSLTRLPCPENHDIRKIHEYASQSQIRMEAQDCGPTEERSSSSEYFSSVSSPSKLPRPNNQGMPVLPVSMNLQQAAISSPFLQGSTQFRFGGNNKPCTSLLRGREEKVMKIYYMRVRMKRGAAVLWDPEEEGLEPSSKKMKFEEMTYIEKVHENIPFFHSSAKKPLIDFKSILDIRAQKKGRQIERPAMLPALKECPRVRTPAWPMAHDCGFRCMACYRVFPSLAVLKEHVEHGIKEGFSCRTFHLALANLKHKYFKEEEEENQDRQHFRCQ